MKTLLINTSGDYYFYAPFKWKKVDKIDRPLTPPLGLLYIARSLEDEGCNVELLELHCEINPEEQIKKSLKSADMVGISVYTLNYTNASYVANIIKNSDADIPVIIGGPHCTYYPKQSLNDIPRADIAIEGEGEVSVKQILEVLNGTKKLSNVPGIHYRKYGNIKSGKPLEVVKDIDSIPFPSRHLVDKYDYGTIKNIPFFKPKVTPMITSRGCPHHCKFCSLPNTRTAKYRSRSAKNVIEEMKEISYKYQSVIIYDDSFLENKKRAFAIMDGLIKNDINLNIYIRGARVDSVNRDLYVKMKKAGVKYIQYGIESGTQEILDFYKKDITIHQIKKAVNLAKEMGFITHANFIFGAPIETKNHIKKTIKFSHSLPLDIVSYRPLIYQYGSELWFEAVSSGKIKKNDGNTVMADSGRNLGIFTSKELIKYCRNASTTFYLRPSYVVMEIITAIKDKDFTLIKIGLSYFKVGIPPVR